MLVNHKGRVLCHPWDDCNTVRNSQPYLGCPMFLMQLLAVVSEKTVTDSPGACVLVAYVEDSNGVRGRWLEAVQLELLQPFRE